MARRYMSHVVRTWFAISTICVAYVKADILVFSNAAEHQVERQFKDLPAKFGGFIPLEGIQGMVAYSEPPTACVSIRKPPNVPDYDGKWIVLIARSSCSFEEKVRMAQAAGYDAAIIHNIDSNDLEPMSAQNPIGVFIPSVFVGEDTGFYIQNEYLYSYNYSVLINDDLPFDLNNHLLLPFVIVVGICFLVMVIFMVIKYIKDRRRQRRHRLPNSSLRKIPTHKYTKGDPYETCAICLEDYAEGEKLRVLPCAHAYHTKCIDPWLTKNRRVCPVCKRKVFAADERVSDTESDTDADDSTPLIRDGHQGTQGGTFNPQRENPFTRAMRGTRNRSGSNSSGSSSGLDSNFTSQPRNPYLDRNRSGSNSSRSSSSSVRHYASADDENNGNGGQHSEGAGFVVSDSHSINGEPRELERSASSTRPHTVNLEVQEGPPTVHIAPTRNPRILVNPVAPNSGHPIILPTNPLPIPTILSEEHEGSDSVA